MSAVPPVAGSTVMAPAAAAAQSRRPGGSSGRWGIVLTGLLTVVFLGGGLWADWERAKQDAGREFEQVASSNALRFALVARDANRFAVAVNSVVPAGAAPGADVLLKAMRERFHAGEVGDWMPAGATRPTVSSDARGMATIAWSGQLDRVGDTQRPVFGWAYQRGTAWMLPLFMRRMDGSVLVISLPIDEIAALWMRPHVVGDIPMGLRSAADIILLRTPYTPDMFGRDASGSPSTQAIRAAAARGEKSGYVTALASETDGRHRIIAWADVPRTNVRFLMAVSQTDMLHRWVAQRWLIFAMVLMAVAAAVVSLGWSRARLKAARDEEIELRQRAEASALMVRMALDASRDTTWRLDPSNGDLRFDSDVGQLLNQPTEWLTPAAQRERHSLEWLLNHVSLEDEARVRTAIARTVRDGVPLYEQFCAQVAGEPPRHFILKGAPTKGHEPALVVGTLRDVTRLMQSQQEAEALLHTLKRMCHLARIGPWTVDVASGKIQLGPGVREIYDLPEHSLPDRWLAFPEVDGSAMPTLQAARQRLLSEGVGYDLVLPVSLKSGQTRWVRTTAVAIHGADGKVVRVDGALQDITAFVQVERQIGEEQQARAAAEARNSAKTAFLSSMSHELRTPLNAVIGYAQLATANGPGESDPATALARFGLIEKAGWHLLALIDDVLDLARIEVGKVELEMAALNLADVVMDAIELVTPQAEAATVAITIHLQPLTCWADNRRLRQVLTNLLSNAVKYNVKGGSVTVTTRAASDGVHIEVRDSGLGMNAEQLARLFEPFNRLGRQGSDTPGTGIGLSISRGLVELMGGTIDCTSQVGRGSAFHLHLQQAVAVEAAPIAPTEAVGAAPAAHGLQVLYVEDDSTNAALFVEALQLFQPTWQVHVAPTLAHASEALSSAVPDFLFLDQNMADGSGLQWLALPDVARLCPPGRVVLVTADVVSDVHAEARALGVAWFLDKPYNFKRLQVLLGKLIDLLPPR